MAMVYAELRAVNLNDWRGRLRDGITNQPMGEEWQADQRGALIGLMRKWIPLSHMVFIDVDDPPTD
ncbi:MAG TPA: hypothetical protein VI168_10450 [Croceibacterium sp.]